VEEKKKELEVLKEKFIEYKSIATKLDEASAQKKKAEKEDVSSKTLRFIEDHKETLWAEMCGVATFICDKAPKHKDSFDENGDQWKCYEYLKKQERTSNISWYFFKE
jgi:hypothetical protein